MTKLPVIFTALALGAGMAQGADAPSGEEVYTVCAACHGGNGRDTMMPNYPKIGGQNRDYLVSALKAYRDGRRQGTFAELMRQTAAGLSDAEIEAVADYVSRLEGY